MTHNCDCGDCNPAPYDNTCKFEEGSDWNASEADRQASLAATLNARINVLEAELRQTIEDFEDAVPYISDYFREKWGYDEAIKRAKTTLGASPSDQNP